MKKIRIIPYEKQYHEIYRKLSLEWLEKFNLYEDVDTPMLENPKEEILDKGGHIFLALYDNIVVGTVALKKVNEYHVEILKLGVNSEYQGLGLGRKLMDHCIEICKKMRMEKIILETNIKLKSAIALYKKLGFKEIIFENAKYEMADFKMELDLT